MYNRYIPQADGTFRRNRIAEPEITPEPSAPAEEPQAHDIPKDAPAPTAHKRTNHTQAPQIRAVPQTPHDAGSVSSFLRGLLPQNFDTEDLIVVLLLLLMSGSSNNDQNAALLTLGIYLFL